MLSHPVLWIAGLGAAVRLVNAPYFSYLPDELATLRWSLEPVATLMTTFGQGATSHLYDLLMRFWIAVFGASALAIRSPSVVAGIATIPLVYVYGRRWLGDPAVAALAALFVALSKPLIIYSRMARPYALLTLVALFSMALLLRALHDGRRRDLVLLTALDAVLLTLSLNAVYLLIVQSLAVAVETVKRPRLGWRRCAELAACLLLSALLAALFYVGTLDSLLSLSRSEKADFFRPELIWATFLHNHPSATLLLLAALLVGCGVALRRHGAAGRLLVLWAVVPILFYVVSRISYPVPGVSRYLVPCLPAQLLLAALGVSAAARYAMRSQPQRALPAAVLMASVICLWDYRLWSPVERPSVFKEQQPTAPALASLRSLLRPGDVLTYDLEARFYWMFAAQGDLSAVAAVDLVRQPRLDRPGRLVVLAYERPEAEDWWSRHFDLRTIGDGRFRERFYLLVSPPLPAGEETLRQPVRDFLQGYVEAAPRPDEEDWWQAAIDFQVLIRVHSLLAGLATTSEEAGEQRLLADRYRVLSEQTMRGVGRHRPAAADGDD